MFESKFYIRSFLFCIGFLFTTISIAQQLSIVDFKTSTIDIVIDPVQESVIGNVSYTFSVLQETDSIFIDARKMKFSKVLLNDESVSIHNDGSKLWLISNFESGKEYTAKIAYKATPKKAMYFIGWEFPNAKKQVWTQGQGKYTSHWLPSLDDMNEKIIFDIQVSFPKEYSVIANGKLLGIEQPDTSSRKWRYDMQKPMSSYLLALAIGTYNRKTVLSSSGIPLEMYYYPEDSLKIEPTYRYTKKIFDFLEKELATVYPWQNYKQIPVKDFLYAGMENTSATIFSDAYMVDHIGFIDKNYVNVNAHELAHQWFGNLVTEKSGTHHWLQEGFATYYALLAEKEVFGEDYFYWKLYKSSQQLIALTNSNGGESLLDPKASSLTFYEKGAWALYILRDKIGDQVFRTIVTKYLEKHQFENVDTQDFIAIAEEESNQNLDAFVSLWLTEKEFPEKEAQKAIASSVFIQKLTAVQEKKLTLENFKKNIADKTIFYPVKTTLIQKLKKLSKETLTSYYTEAFNDNDLKTRQEIIVATDTIPVSLKKEFESLLNDNSYITVEETLFKLWLNFPEDRIKYLDKTKGLYGFNNRRLRLLWLTLVLATPEYDSKNTPAYYNELSGYTAPKYHFEVRQNTNFKLIPIKI